CVVEVQLGTPQPPSRIHAGELDLHADRRVCPLLYLFLVRGQFRQEQAKQTDCDRKQDDEYRPQVDQVFSQLSQQCLHVSNTVSRSTALQISTTSNWSLRYSDSGCSRIAFPVCASIFASPFASSASRSSMMS